MARKTLEQMAAEAAVEREARLVQEVREYPARLMAVLARAVDTSIANLVVEDNKFQVQIHNSRTVFSLAYAQSPNSQEQLEELEAMLDNRERELVKERARSAARSAALAKLTKEERELLNLN